MSKTYKFVLILRSFSKTQKKCVRKTVLQTVSFRKENSWSWKIVFTKDQYILQFLRISSVVLQNYLVLKMSIHLGIKPELFINKILSVRVFVLLVIQVMFLNLVFIVRHKSEWFVDETNELEIKMNFFFEKPVEEIAYSHDNELHFRNKNKCWLYGKEFDSVGTKVGGPCQ